MSELEKYQKGVYRCARCGICRSKYSWDQKIFRVCPSGEHTAGFWTDFPIGRVEVGRNILEHRLDISNAPVESIYQCLLCGNCREVCGAIDMATGGPLVDQPRIVKALRADLFASGAKLPEHVNMFSNAIEKSQNIFGAPVEERNDWLIEDIKLDKKAKTIYFPGCLSSYRDQSTAQATAKVLNILGIPFNILGEEEQCCGNPMLMVGNLFLARDLMQHNYELMKGKKVIASCAGCYRTFLQDYPKLLGDDCKVDAIHIVKVLAEQIEQGKIRFTKEIREKVVYHDPCELGRDMQVYDEPRKILEAIPGITVVEFVRNKERTFCCGAGGGVKGINFDLSIEIAKDKVKEALATGATTLVSACPSCKTNINDAIKATGAKLRAIDITELLIEAGIHSARKEGNHA